MRRFPDEVYYKRLAATTGYPPTGLERVLRLSTVLHAISEELGAEVCLRGGTALNLIHLDVPRLSVDIDLDFVGASDAPAATQRRPSLLGDLAAIGEGTGFRVSYERASYAMAHLHLEYDDIRGLQSFVKLDVNFLDRVPVLPTVTMRVRHPFVDDIPEFSTQTLALSELAAAKLVALCRRTLARDLFDVAALHETASLDMDLVRSILVVRGAAYRPPTPRDYDEGCVDLVKGHAWNAEVLALVRRPAPFSLEQAQAAGRALLRPALELANDQRSFLDALDRGELRADLLEPPLERERVEANPGVLWRVQRGPAGLEER